jgi:Flp pilus assembly pilin Flp
MLRLLLAERRGAVAVEYAMIAVGIAAAIAAVVFQLGTAIETVWYSKLLGMFGG